VRQSRIDATTIIGVEFMRYREFVLMVFFVFVVGFALNLFVQVAFSLY
jgi:hypothetical protein